MGGVQLQSGFRIAAIRSQKSMCEEMLPDIQNSYLEKYSLRYLRRSQKNTFQFGHKNTHMVVL